MATITKSQLEYKQEQELLKAGKFLVNHKGGPFYNRGPANRPVAEKEASELGLKGVIRKLFLREREEGYIAAGQFIEAQEQGLLDEFVTPITALLAGTVPGLSGYTTGQQIAHYGQKGADQEPPHLNAPGAGSTSAKTNAKTGRLETTQHPAITESAEKAVPSIGLEIGNLIKEYGLRLGEVLAGAALILFGLVTLAKGSAPSVTVAP
jgi:hypothetical protein